MDEKKRSGRNLEGEEVGIEHRDDRAAAEREVADRHADPEREPHHELSNPASDPDPTEYPDPYEQRLDPRDPDAVDTPAKPAERAAGDQTGGPPPDPSTSDPPPPRNIETARREGFDPER